MTPQSNGTRVQARPAGLPAVQPFAGPGDLLADAAWQMTLGERAALEGLLVRLAPDLAIEIGTADGGSARCIARHAREVHSFDLVHPEELTEEIANVVTHTGDSHLLVPAFLDRLAVAGRHVDFALVDGDHTADGVRRDVEDLLGSPAVVRTVIVAHDTANEDVRSGLLALDLAARPEVAYVDLDFVAGHLSAGGAFAGQLWGGLGLIVVDAVARRARGRRVVGDEFHPGGELLRVARDALAAGRPPTG